MQVAATDDEKAENGNGGVSVANNDGNGVFAETMQYGDMANSSDISIVMAAWHVYMATNAWR